MNFTLRIWRQASLESVGNLEMYRVRDISPDCSGTAPPVYRFTGKVAGDYLRVS